MPASGTVASSEHALARVQAQERKLRRLLGTWVSEIEPAAVFDCSSGTLLGLTGADATTGGHARIWDGASWRDHVEILHAGRRAGDGAGPDVLRRRS